MAKQIKIKDIAQMAGVSAGTVDRVLHNRGNVSYSSREAVERVLADVDYRYNIHTSAVSLKKGYRIAITTPAAGKGEYWGSIVEGFRHALEEYSDINIDCRYFFYNQFDVYSCRSAFSGIAEEHPDAVIIGPTFISETVALCSKLDEAGIPYAFVDSAIEDTRPFASYSTDQHACGAIIGRLLCSMTPPDSSIAIFSTRRVGNRRANNSLERMKGFMDYMDSSGRTGHVKEASFSALDPEDNEKDVTDFLRANPDVKGIAVMNSRGYIIADILKANGIEDVKIVSFDLTHSNSRCLQDGGIAALLCQRPQLQGFNAVKAAINRLIYKNVHDNPHRLMPIDIIFRENLPYYREIIPD